MFVSTLDPIAFSIGPLSIRWYGLLFSIGFIIGYCIMQYFFRKKNYKTEDLDKLLVYIFVGTVLGARLAHCFIYEPDFYLKYPSRILMIWEGGLASHGGCLGVLIAVLLFLRKTSYRFLELADMLCVPTALVCSMIRMGNFINSEILGIPTLLQRSARKVWCSVFSLLWPLLPDSCLNLLRLNRQITTPAT